jgi:hypothetical protein
MANQSTGNALNDAMILSLENQAALLKQIYICRELDLILESLEDMS